MAPSVNRTAVYLTIAAFLIFGVFCVGTQAPLIQADILRRCQDTLSLLHIPLEGLTVRGRDVILTGPAESAIMSARIRSILANVSGVRDVNLHVESEGTGRLDSQNIQPTGNAQQREAQEKIDRILENQGIAFNAESAVLTKDSEMALDRIVAYLAEIPNLQCEIRGYDNHPRVAKPNLTLALQRALATEDYIVGRGIAEWRLSTHAFKVGEGTEARPTNRAVDLVVRVR